MAVCAVAIYHTHAKAARTDARAQSGPVSRLTPTAAGASCTIPLVGLRGWCAVAGECTSYQHTRLVEQTNSGVSHFRPPKSHFCRRRQSVRNSTQTRPGRHVSRRSENDVVSIGALRTDIHPSIQTEIGLSYYSIGYVCHVKL